MKGRVLIVAGSDSGGGAGIQADVKTITALGGYCGTAITVVTAQDTKSVTKIEPVSVDMVARQMHMMLDDIGVDCIKMGMLYSHDIIEAVTDVIDAKARGVPLVIDPVLVAKSGDRLLEENALQAFTTRLILHASIITPNIPEAEVLSGIAVTNRDDMVRAAKIMHDQGVPAVLLKGGHMTGDLLTDLLQTEEGTELFETKRINSIHTHGTGCTLASGIATGIAQGMELRDAIRRAREFVRQAIAAAPGFGSGHGPLDHTVTVRPLDGH